MSLYQIPILALSASIQSLDATTVAQNSYVSSSSTVLAEKYRLSTKLYLTGSSNCFVSYALLASTSSYTVKLASGDALNVSDYGGPISFIFDGTTGSLKITKEYMQVF